MKTKTTRTTPPLVLVALVTLAALFALFATGLGCGGSIDSADARDGGVAGAAHDAGVATQHEPDGADGRDAAAAATIAVPPPIEHDDGCGLGVNGALQASINGVASASGAGSEIPFLLVRCEASANNVAYEVLEQVVGNQVNEVFLNAGTGKFVSTSPCATTASLDGDAAPFDATGEHVQTTAKCAALADDTDGRTVALEVWISTVVTARK